MLDPGFDSPPPVEAEDQESKPKGFLGVLFGPLPTADELLEQIRVKEEAQVEQWRHDTSAVSWLMWPGWAFGWGVGLVIAFVRAVWANVRRGFLRHNSGPWDDDE